MIKDLKLDLAIQTAKMDETATRDTGELHGHPNGAGACASVHKLHSDYRSSLTVQTTNMLLTISLESQAIEDFHVCFDHWLADKDRRGYTAMVEESRKPALPSLAHDLPLNLSWQW